MPGHRLDNGALRRRCCFDPRECTQYIARPVLLIYAIVWLGILAVVKMKKRLLLVEDLPFDSELTLRAIGQSGTPFEISLARDGWDALVLMKNQDFDLILLDLKMPRMNGFETMILKNGYGLQAGVPVIILTNSNLEADRLEAQRLGAAGYLHKALDYAEFSDRLAATLRQY